MALSRYILKDGKRLRYGYTTGSCATAASKAAAWMLLKNQPLHSVEIDTPKGWRLNLSIEDIEMSSGSVSCSVVKDGGDDPDVTHGLKIHSRVQWRSDGQIIIEGGPGVGRVTRRGLPVKVGMAAINPVPRRMIEEAVRSVIGPEGGADVLISVPSGEAVAQKTFNPRLGIVGGISILGTSGIVEPMSEEAYKESLAIELNLLVEEGIRSLVMVPGNYGRDLARDQLKIPPSYIFKFSNFIGYILDEAFDKNVERILLVGHVGKIIKVAGGIFHTHSRVADGRMEILTAYLALMGASPSELKKIITSNTTEEAVDLIYDMGYEKIFDTLAEKITEKCRQRTHHRIQLGTVIFSMERGILAKCSHAKNLLEGFQNE